MPILGWAAGTQKIPYPYPYPYPSISEREIMPAPLESSVFRFVSLRQPKKLEEPRRGVAQQELRELGQDRGDFGGHSLPITLRIARSWALSSHQAG